MNSNLHGLDSVGAETIVLMTLLCQFGEVICHEQS